MVAESDIVIDNIRPGAMERSHLGYEDLKKIKPDIIQCSIKMWGNEGPLGYQTGYAPCFAALSGLVNDVTLGISWAFVALRVAHSSIQCSYNRVMHRFVVFLLGVACLMALWGWLAYGLLH